MDEPLKIKLNELYTKIKPLIKERRTVKNELLNQREKRDTLNKKYYAAREEALRQRESRDEFNKRVKDVKKRIGTLNLELSEKSRRQRVLKKRLSLLDSQVRKEEYALEKIQSLEWRIQTTSMTVDQERKIIDEIKHLGLNLQAHKEAQSIKEQLKKLRHVIGDYEKSLSQLRDEKCILVEEGHYRHIQMLSKFEEAQEVKRKVDQAHKEYLSLKEKLEASQNHYIEILTAIKSVERELDEEFAKEKAEKVERIKKQLEERAQEKLKKKKKMTIDELKMLIKHDHQNTE